MAKRTDLSTPKTNKKTYLHAKAYKRTKGQKQKQELFHIHPDKYNIPIKISMGNEIMHIDLSATSEAKIRQFNAKELSQNCHVFKILPNLSVCIWKDNPEKGFIIKTGGEIANHLDTGDFKKGFTRYGVFLRKKKRLKARIL